jgi:hypothetical protein
VESRTIRKDFGLFHVGSLQGDDDGFSDSNHFGRIQDSGRDNVAAHDFSVSEAYSRRWLIQLEQDSLDLKGYRNE